MKNPRQLLNCSVEVAATVYTGVSKVEVGLYFIAVGR